MIRAAKRAGSRARSTPCGGRTLISKPLASCSGPVCQSGANFRRATPGAARGRYSRADRIVKTTNYTAQRTPGGLVRRMAAHPRTVLCLALLLLAGSGSATERVRSCADIYSACASICIFGFHAGRRSGARVVFGSVASRRGERRRRRRGRGLACCTRKGRRRAHGPETRRERFLGCSIGYLGSAAVGSRMQGCRPGRGTRRGGMRRQTVSRRRA